VLAVTEAAAVVVAAEVVVVAEEVAAETVERRAVACGQFRGIRGPLVKAARSPYGWARGQSSDSTIT
jgi:hypothetical protein